MSREQLRRRFCGLTCPNPEDHGIKPWMCETAAEEIERLLAAEREKVREMCVLAACPDCKAGLPLEKYNNGNEFHVTQVGENDYEQAQCFSEGIRQLDLTKDLAASSRGEISIRSFKDMAALDEGGEEKGND